MEEEIIITTAANYWISPNAISINLNALGEPNRIQASIASGAEIMCYVRGVKAASAGEEYAKNGDGLEYDNAHNYRHWPLIIAPTYFNSNDEKYLYVAIPRKASVGTEAMVVFPSKKIDIFGYVVDEEDGNESAERKQIGTDDYFYIFLQGIISSSGDSGSVPRVWQAPADTGYLNSDEAYSTTETSWYRWDPISQTVTFMKEIFMDAASIFQNLKAVAANIRNLNVTGILDAVKSYIDDIRSHNYEQGIMNGTGFRLTSDNGDGNSMLEVDMLNVRKKATFMELEIREETYVGGNQHYSPAGSKIYRVEYLDEDGDMKGYTEMKVPWLLKRFSFVVGVFNYAARKRIRRSLTPEEWSQVHHFRCFLLADDGTTATRNWWRVGDQPRCQSFNKASSSQDKREHTYDSGGDEMADPATPMAKKNTTSEPLETSYYWRMVSNTGSQRLDDGHVYDYIDMPYEGWSKYTDAERNAFRDPGSGIPVAGDTIVCMGNRYDEGRMNMISLNSIADSSDGTSAPSIIGYRAINKFRLSHDNRVFNISPNEFLVRSKVFRLLDDSGYEFPVPLDRGTWLYGPRYHWYDQVTWKGSLWLCLVTDESVWENGESATYLEHDPADPSGGPKWAYPDGTKVPAGPITDEEVGEGDYQYTVGGGSGEAQLTWEDERSKEDVGTAEAPSWTNGYGNQTNRDYSVENLKEYIGGNGEADIFFLGYDDENAPGQGWGIYNSVQAAAGGWSIRSMRSKRNFYYIKGNDVYIYISADYGTDPNTDECWRFDHAVNLLNVNDPYFREVENYVLSQETALGVDDLYSRSEEYGFNYQYYDCRALLFLERVLSEQTAAGRRIFIQHHHFSPQKAGNGKAVGGTGAYYSKNGIRPYREPMTAGASCGSYNLSGVQFHFLNVLNRKYPKAICFTGHSHIIFDDKRYDAYLNFCNKEFRYKKPTATDSAADWNGADKSVPAFYTPLSDTPVGTTGWNVHLPSLSRPSTIASGTMERLPKWSQGAVMEVYDDYVKIIGLSFKDGGSSYLSTPRVVTTLVVRTSDGAGWVDGESGTPSSLGTLRYRVGYISDSHYNSEGDATEFAEDIEHAMDYFDSLPLMAFVSSCGDMVEENNKDLVMFTRLWANKAKVLNGGSWPADGKTGFQLIETGTTPKPSMRLMCVLGNHDVRQVYGRTSNNYNSYQTGNKWNSVARLTRGGGGGTGYTGTDHYTKTAKVNGQTVYYVRLWTFSEPSDTNDLWLKQVSKGTEITQEITAYAASVDGTKHPDNYTAEDYDPQHPQAGFRGWKSVGSGERTPDTDQAAIAATGIADPQHSYGTYLWTRTTRYYSDGRQPTVSYSVGRYGIDADGIYQIDSKYYGTEEVINDMEAYERSHVLTWYDTFADLTDAHGGVGQMQGWFIWEKTIVKYDRHFDETGTEDTKPDVITYKCSRIGQDGQIGMEEYYLLSEYNDFDHAFGGTTYDKVGIRWYKPSDPASENWRLSDTTPNINTQMWSPTMPVYNKDTHGKKVYLWNFEQRVDGTGTEYATKPVCIGNHARGITGIIELYALSSSQTPISAQRPIPSDINAKNTWGVIPTSGFSDPQVWGDERYDRAPTEALPYQWNWTRTLYSTKDANGKDYEDHYHVSAVRGTNGEDGAGVEYIYFLGTSETYSGTHPKDITKDAAGVQRDASYIASHDDFVPYGWTDNPSGISYEKQYEFVSMRKKGAPDGNGRKLWGAFSDPELRSNWGKAGVDGDGCEYVFIRTKTNVAPTIVNSDDSRRDSGNRTYKDDEYLPLATGGSLGTSQTECTDDPKGVTSTYKFEWVAKRTKAQADGKTGVRIWEKYSGTMSLFSNFAESITKTSETYRYATNNTGTRPAATSADWKTTRPTLQKGYWLYTETTITWSDGSKTVLYTDERNPNDGVAGQDIISDGTTVTYALTDTNVQPADSAFGPYPSTLTPGKWLWSKATTYYRKSSSAAGSHDAGSSSNYNVSYIAMNGTNGKDGKDGEAGRAVTSITEYYKANNSSAELPVPTSDAGWSTNPNVDNWGANNKYLWNYEKVTYSSGTTVERTKPQIVAIWTEDGKGIDSIVNYYKVLDTATPSAADLKRIDQGGTGWDDDPTAPGPGQYLWNYEEITYTDGTHYRSEPQMIGHSGKDAGQLKISVETVFVPADSSGKSTTEYAQNISVEMYAGGKRCTIVATGTSVTKASSMTNVALSLPTVGSGGVTTYNFGVTVWNAKAESTYKGDIALVMAGTLNGKTYVGYGTVAVQANRKGDAGANGEPGHVGRWYYYAGEYAGPPSNYVMEATQSPYVKASDGNYYMLDFRGVEPASHRQAAGYGPLDAGQTNWSPMTATFKYIITEAIFGAYAHFGSFIINSDWMLSQHGVMYDPSGGAHTIDDNNSWSDYTKDNAYTMFSPSYPNTARPGYINFCPNYAVDGKTGKTYQNDAYVKGQIVAMSGQIAGSMSVTGELAVGISSDHDYLRIYRLNITGVNYGSVIEGWKESTRLYRLGYNQEYANAGISHDAALTFGNYSDQNVFITKTSVRVGKGSSYGSMRMVGNRFTISSSNWPSYNEAAVGDIYVGSAGALYVKLT